MLASLPSTQRIQGYCALCTSRCGSIAVIENGRFVALEPDPSHPTGKALCAKGRAAPELADIVLPVASAFEREALKFGFEISPEAQSLVQLRQRVVEPRGEARSDTEIVFDLATRLGLGQYFWDGDIQAAYRYQLAPSGISLEALRRQPGGVSLPQPLRYRRYAEPADGSPRGLNTPTRKIELYSERLFEHGYPPLPEFEEPLVSPFSRPDLAERFPLILTCAKNTLYCES